MTSDDAPALYPDRYGYGLLHKINKSGDWQGICISKQNPAMKNTILTTLLSASLITGISLSGCGNTQSQKMDSTQIQDSKAAQDAPSETSVGGTYEFGEDIEKGPIGMVKIHPLGADSILFYIDVNRGAPSYNMGQLAGKIALKNGTAEYKNNDCHVKFSFKDKSLHVDQQGDCEFGHAVSASGEYKLTDPTIPTYYIKSDGDTVRFQP